MNTSEILSIDDFRPSYITNNAGERTSVVLPIGIFEQLLEKVTDMTEDYELGKLVVERRSQKDQAIRVALDDL